VAGGEGLPDARLTRLAAFVEARQDAAAAAPPAPRASSAEARRPGGGAAAHPNEAVPGAGARARAAPGSRPASAEARPGAGGAATAMLLDGPRACGSPGRDGAPTGADRDAEAGDADGAPGGAPPGDWVALEALVLACRSAASLQPDGTGRPPQRCRARPASRPHGRPAASGVPPGCCSSAGAKDGADAVCQRETGASLSTLPVPTVLLCKQPAGPAQCNPRKGLGTCNVLRQPTCCRRAAAWAASPPPAVPLRARMSGPAELPAMQSALVRARRDGAGRPALEALNHAGPGSGCAGHVATLDPRHPRPEARARAGGAGPAGRAAGRRRRGRRRRRRRRRRRGARAGGGDARARAARAPPRRRQGAPCRALRAAGARVGAGGRARSPPRCQHPSMCW